MGVSIVCVVVVLYIPIWLYSNAPTSKFLQKRSNFTFQSGYIQIVGGSRRSGRRFNLYIPIWLYSNPSPIIPSIQDILNPIFCLPGYSQVQNYYGGCILLLLNIHLPLFYNICRTLYILQPPQVDNNIYIIIIPNIKS